MKKEKLAFLISHKRTTKKSLFICILFLLIGLLFTFHLTLQAQNLSVFSSPPCTEFIPNQILIRPYFQPQKLFENRNPIEVFRNIDKIKLNNARDIEISIRASNFLRENGYYKEAREIAFKVLNKESQSSAALYIIGNTYQDEENFPKALEYYLKIEKINTTMLDLHFGIGVLYYQMDKQNMEKPLKEYELEMRYNPLNWKPYLNRGMIYGHMGEYEKAFEDCAKAVELSKNDIYALLAAARFSEQLQVQTKRGKEFLQRALKLYPRSWRAWEIKAGFYYHDKEYRKAEKAYIQSFKLYNRTTTLYELSWTYVKMGRIAQAKQIYDRANSMAPQEDNCYKQKTKEYLTEKGVVF